MLTRIKALLGAFARDEGGNIVMIAGLSIFTMLTATGVAVDMARAQILQNRIQAALDAAGLAAGATANTVDVQVQATKYFNVNFPAGYMGAAPVTVNAALAMGGQKVNLVATTTQPTTFLQAVGITTVNVGANTEITRTNEGLELALVLDNTGSMGDPVSSSSSVSKLNALKCALAGNKAHGATSTYCSGRSLVTTGLLDILYGTSDSISDLFVSMVPFSDLVKIPTSQATAIITGYSSAACVNARSTSTNSAINPATTVTYTNGSTATVNITLDMAEDPPGASPYHFTRINTSDCPDSPVIPLQQSKSTLITGIRTMTAEGNTMINIGLTWGWRSISPHWQETWVGLPRFYNGSENLTMPLEYGTTRMNKVVVLMTDGQNVSGSNGAYGSSAPNATTLDNKTLTLCTAMKNAGITIYTIGFGRSSDVDSDLLRACATKPSYYFFAPTNADLGTAFQTIGDALANLRVSQ